MSMLSEEIQSRQGNLGHVLWVGGSTFAGTSSVARWLGQTYGLPVYNAVHHEDEHVALSVDRTRFLAIHEVMEMSTEERWVLRSPKEMLRDAVVYAEELFPHVIDDLQAMPADGPIVAEAPGLFPALVRLHMINPGNGVWLIATDDVIQARLQKRRPEDRTWISDPDKAMDNLLRREYLMAHFVREQANKLSLKVMEIDGTESVVGIAERVAQHFELVMGPGQMKGAV